jgi:hypothetical protein
MKLLCLASLLIICFNFNAQETNSKDSTKTVLIILNDGSQKSGKILSDDGREILLDSDKIGKIYIAKSNIKEIKDFKKEEIVILDGEIILESPFTTRYAFTSNAFPLKKNVNYAMINLYGPEVHFAVSNRFSLGIMSTWIGSPLALNAKYSFPTKDKEINYSLGIIAGTSGYIFKGQGYGTLGWGTVTIGNRMQNISLSAGYGSIGNLQDATKFRGGALFSLAGITKIGKKASLIFDSMLSETQKSELIYTPITTSTTDNFGNPTYTTEYVPVTQKTRTTAFFLMPGFRFQSTENKAFQISLAGVININSSNTTSFPLPMCSWFYKL